MKAESHALYLHVAKYPCVLFVTPTIIIGGSLRSKRFCADRERRISGR